MDEQTEESGKVVTGDAPKDGGKEAEINKAPEMVAAAPEAVGEVDVSSRPEMTTGRRVWHWAAIVISALVLVLGVGGIIGTWVARGVAIEAVNGLMDGIDQLAGVGREGTMLVDNRVGELRTTVGEVQSAVDQVAQNVSDQGLILTLLPPEKEQELTTRADRIRETAGTIISSIEAALELYNTIDSIPFVNLPRPDEERLDAVRSDVQAIQDGVDQLRMNIQQFRDDAAAQVNRVSNAAGQVNARMEQAENRLEELDNELASLQTRAQAFADQFATIATVGAIVFTLILGWIAYALADNVYGHWQELHA